MAVVFIVGKTVKKCSFTRLTKYQDHVRYKCFLEVCNFTNNKFAKVIFPMRWKTWNLFFDTRPVIYDQQNDGWRWTDNPSLPIKILKPAQHNTRSFKAKRRNTKHWQSSGQKWYSLVGRSSKGVIWGSILQYENVNIKNKSGKPTLNSKSSQNRGTTRFGARTTTVQHLPD